MLGLTRRGIMFSVTGPALIFPPPEASVRFNEGYQDNDRADRERNLRTRPSKG